MFIIINMLLKKDAFIKNKYYKLLFAFLLSCTVVILSEMFDSFAAGKYVDENAVIAIELVTPIESVEYAIIVFLTYGTATIYNKERGSHNLNKSKQIAGMGLLSSFVCGLGMFVIAYFLAPQIIGLYDCTKEVFDYAVSYLKMESFYLIPYVLFYHLYYLAMADGDEISTTLSSVISSVLAMILPNILAANFGLMGIASTLTVTYVVALLLCSLHFLSKRNTVHYRLYFSLHDFLEVIKSSSAYSLSNIYLAITDIIFNSVIIANYSSSHILAYSVINFTLNLGEVLVVAIASARASIDY